MIQTLWAIEWKVKKEEDSSEALWLNAYSRTRNHTLLNGVYAGGGYVVVIREQYR